MASNSRAAEHRRPPRLYLIAAVTDGAEFAADLPALLHAADVAALLLRLRGKAADERALISTVRRIAPAVQSLGVALIIDGRPDLVARTSADGAHLSGITALQEALPALKPDRIAGAGLLPTRHDAMLAAEAGADYVMFGEPDGEGNRLSFAAIVERIAWWADVFESPCVGYAGSLDEVSELAAARADFIAVGDLVFTAGDPLATLASVAQRLQAEEPAR